MNGSFGLFGIKPPSLNMVACALRRRIDLRSVLGDQAAIEKLRKELAAQHGVKIGYSAADMSKPAEIGGMIETAQRELGAVDILVNNAGIQHVAPVESFPDDRWDAIIAINL